MGKFNINTKKINIILVVGIFVVVTIVSIIKGGNGNTGSFNLTKDALTIIGPDNYSITVNLKELDNIEVIEEFDKGTMISGGEKNSYSYGVWSCDRFPEYNLCALTKLKTVIAATENDGDVYVFNFESDKTTKSFYDSLIEYINTPETTVAN